MYSFFISYKKIIAILLTRKKTRHLFWKIRLTCLKFLLKVDIENNVAVMSAVNSETSIHLPCLFHTKKLNGVTI